MPVIFQFLVPTGMPGNSKLIHMLVWKMDKWGLHMSELLKVHFLHFYPDSLPPTNLSAET